MNPLLARTFWRYLEAVHAVTYFSPECRAANQEVGLRGFWMGYFASRAAPMGPVPPGVVAATFFNFHPAMVRRAIPDAWSFASPTAIVAARSVAAEKALYRLVPDMIADLADAGKLLARTVEAADEGGRPLFAANRDLALDAIEGVAATWQHATCLREHRGDGHVAVLLEAGLDGCQAHVMYAATEGIPAEILQLNRGWSIEDWDVAKEELHRRNLLGRTGNTTDAGRDLRARIERRTDELAAAPYRALDDESVDWVLNQLRPIAQQICASGDIPFPNPIGLPPAFNP